MRTGAVTKLSPAKSPQKSVTPVSVKALMIIEAGIAGFLSYWLYSEYQYNIYFQIYVNTNILQHLTTYTILIGLGIGLAGSAAAATLYRNLQHAKTRLGTIAAPKFRGTVDKILSTMPAGQTLLGATVTSVPASSAPQSPETQGTSTTAIVPFVSPVEQKKSA